MNKIRSFLLVLALVSGFRASAASLMGPGASGGGKAAVCRAADGSIKSVELLDLWEAREIYSLKLQPASGDVKTILEKALTSLSQMLDTDRYIWGDDSGTIFKGAPGALKLLELQADQFSEHPTTPWRAQVKRLHGVRLTLTSDSFEDVQPADCGVEQVVIYKDENAMQGTILINQDLVDQMSPTQQAALYAHEALYKVLRAKGESNSLRVRRAVGLAFSGAPLVTVKETQLPKEHYACSSDQPYDPITRTGGASNVFIFAIPPAAPGEIDFVFEVTRIANLDVLDQGVSDGSKGAYVGQNFKDLSDLEFTNNLDVETEGTVQPELRINLRVDSAGPNGQLKMSIAAPASVILPNGLAWQPLTCVYQARGAQ